MACPGVPLTQALPGTADLAVGLCRRDRGRVFHRGEEIVETSRAHTITLIAGGFERRRRTRGGGPRPGRPATGHRAATAACS